MKATKGEFIDFIEWIKQQKGSTLTWMSENIVDKYGTEMNFEHLRLYPYRIPPPPTPPMDRNRYEGETPEKPPMIFRESLIRFVYWLHRYTAKKELNDPESIVNRYYCEKLNQHQP